MVAKVTRRRLLRSAAVGAAALLVACQPKVVEKIVKETVVVKEKEVVKETVVVQGTPQVVEKVVKETVVVEKVATAVPAPAKKVALRCHVRAGADEEFHKMRIGPFEEQYPNIKIVLEAFPGDMYFTKILSMNATGTVGDVVFTNLAGGRMMQWSYQGVFLPLSSFTEVDAEFKKEDYFPAALDAYTFEGVLHALPEKATTNAAILYYNKKMFGDAGVPEPTDDWTVDTVVEAGQKLVKDTTGDGKTDIWGLMKAVYPNTYVVDMRIFGGEYLSKDGKECLADAPEATAAIQWLSDLILKHKIHPGSDAADVTTFADARTFFFGQKAAMLHEEMLPTGLLKTFSKDAFEVGVAIFPKGPTGKRGNMIGSTGLGVSPHSRNPEQAWEWIKFMANKETGVLRMTGVGDKGTPGARYDVWDDERILADPVFKTYRNVINELMPWHVPANFRAAECFTLMQNTYPKIWIEKAPVKDVIAEVAAETRKILAQPRP